MAWSYNVSELKTNVKDQIRLRIGDTIQDETSLQDEEIVFYLEQANGDINRAAYACVSVLITRLCNLPDYTLGPYSESHGNRLKAFYAVKEDLAKQSMGFSCPVSAAPTTDPIFSYDIMSVAHTHNNLNEGGDL